MDKWTRKGPVEEGVSMRIERPNYIKALESILNTKTIKALSGLRCSGKSTLLRQVRDQLKASGVPDERIVQINFEDPGNRWLQDPEALKQTILERLSPSGKTCVFLEELQEVPDFPRVLSALAKREEIDLYLSCSMDEASLKEQLAGLPFTVLTVEPLSYPEYLQLLAGREVEQNDAFYQWLTKGGLPYCAGFTDGAWRTYIDGVYNTILIRDVLQRSKISDVSLLQALLYELAVHPAKAVSAAGLAAALSQSGKKITSKTVDSYLQALCSASLLQAVSRYDLKSGSVLERNPTYYFGDTGFLKLIAGEAVDYEGLLKNAVYLELKRRGYTVYAGRLSQENVDFVAIKGSEQRYYQVRASILDEKTREKTFRSLKRIDDNYPKTILSTDLFNFSADGIRHQNLTDFFLESQESSS